MKPTAIIPLLFAGAVSSVYGQETQQSRYNFHFGALFSSGGDDLIDVELTGTTGGNRSDTISAGGGFAFFAGVSSVVSENVELRATLGYHTDSVNATNGETSFTRIPLEGSLHYRFQKHQVGAGLSYILNPTFELDIEQAFGPRVRGEIDFEDTLGFFVQYDYAFRNYVNLGIKYLVADYDAASVEAPSIDGSHFSLIASYRF